jgi:hypothetical protein
MGYLLQENENPPFFKWWANGFIGTIRGSLNQELEIYGGS